MKVQLIRNATLKVSFAETTFLVDPMLGEKGSFESYGNISQNPITDLPFSADEVLNDIDAVLISHLHKDHFDDAAKEQINKNIPVFCQPNNDKQIADNGFTSVTVIKFSLEFNHINIQRTSGKHGRNDIEKLMGTVSGFLLSHKDEPSVYIVGDSVFNEEVKSVIDNYHPEIIITNSGGAFIPGYENDLILMNENETIELANYANHSKIIAVHLESLDHCTVNRANLERSRLQHAISKNRFYIPLDGDILEFHSDSKI